MRINCDKCKKDIPKDEDPYELIITKHLLSEEEEWGHEQKTIISRDLCHKCVKQMLHSDKKRK